MKMKKKRKNIENGRERAKKKSEEMKKQNTPYKKTKHSLEEKKKKEKLRNKKKRSWFKTMPPFIRDDVLLTFISGHFEISNRPVSLVKF